MAYEPHAHPRYVGLGKVIGFIVVVGSLVMVSFKAFLYNVVELEVREWTDLLVTGLALGLGWLLAVVAARSLWPSDTTRLLGMWRRKRG
jgi:hypothetical protein